MSKKKVVDARNLKRLDQGYHSKRNGNVNELKGLVLLPWKPGANLTLKKKKQHSTLTGRISNSNSFFEYDHEFEQRRWIAWIWTHKGVSLCTCKWTCMGMHAADVVLVLHHSWWCSECNLETEKHSGYNSLFQKTGDESCLTTESQR